MWHWKGREGGAPRYQEVLAGPGKLYSEILVTTWQARIGTRDQGPQISYHGLWSLFLSLCVCVCVC